MSVTVGSTIFVFAAALVTALATGLGALPFAFVEVTCKRWLGIANGAAAGVMLGASISLLVEGAGDNLLRTALGAAVGAVFVGSSFASSGSFGFVIAVAITTSPKVWPSAWCSFPGKQACEAQPGGASFPACRSRF
jgi:hypothetical protein